VSIQYTPHGASPLVRDLGAGDGRASKQGPLRGGPAPVMRFACLASASAALPPTPIHPVSVRRGPGSGRIWPVLEGLLRSACWFSSRSIFLRVKELTVGIAYIIPFFSFYILKGSDNVQLYNLIAFEVNVHTVCTRALTDAGSDFFIMSSTNMSLHRGTVGEIPLKIQPF
jgi:hypothetical protein